MTSADGDLVVRIHQYGYAGFMDADLEAAFCPGPMPVAGWSYELVAN